MHQIGQDQVIKMAFVAGDKNKRAFLRGDFDPVQPFGIQGYAVEHGAYDPADCLGGNTDHGGIIPRGDFIQIFIGLLVNFMDGDILLLSMMLHKISEAVVC